MELAESPQSERMPQPLTWSGTSAVPAFQKLPSLHTCSPGRALSPCLLDWRLVSVSEGYSVRLYSVHSSAFGLLCTQMCMGVLSVCHTSQGSVRLRVCAPSRHRTGRSCSEKPSCS